MKRLSVSLLVAVLAVAVTTARAENASDIVKRFEAQKAEALEAYLKSNAAAKDAAEATDALIHAYTELGNGKAAGALMEAKLAKLPKGADLNPQEYFTTLQSALEVLSEAGDKAKARQLLTNATKDVEGHPQADRMKQFLTQMGSSLNQPGPGDTMEIAFTSLQGHPVNLADMKGKVVLVDFWATWCGPCVGELPNVKKTYDAWHEKGFEIVAISLDEDKAKLESFIKERDMPWPQDFTGKGWQTDLAVKYGISSIPATFLVGKDGKIVAANLRGEALEKAVAKQLGE